MTLVYGTHNEAKLAHMRRMLAGLPLEVEGLAQAGAAMPPVPETGRDPLENATQKATAYYKVLGRPVFSCDSGLYIEGLPDTGQPGVHVRTVNGRELDDEEMITHYAAIARRLGGRCTARYRNAICLVLGEDQIIRHMGDALSGAAFLLADVPHPTRRPGYPLDSLSMDIATGRYHYDLDNPNAYNMDAGFRAFFQGVLASHHYTALQAKEREQ